MNKNTNKNYNTVFNTVLRGSLFILGVISLLIALFLAYQSIFTSFYTPTDGSMPYSIDDSLPANIVFLLFAVGFVFLLDLILKHFPKKQEIISYSFLAICATLFFAIGCIWTIQVPYSPTGDQINTTAAASYALHGNFDMFQKGGYIGIYSQQKGLVFLYEIIFSLFGSYCYNVVEKFHVFSGVLVMIFGFLFLKDFNSRCLYRCLYCLCILLCAPYIILMPYAYGDIPSICYCVILFWAIQRYGLTAHKRYIIASCFAAILALFNRQNSWIVLIAIGIGFCLLALEKKSIRPLIAGSCIILIAALSVKALSISYEIRSGYEDTGGTPASLYFAMGMQEGYMGYGTYNRFNQGTYQSVDFDREAAAKLGWEEVERRLDFFNTYPDLAAYFFKTKVRQQWIEPLFETLVSTGTFSEEHPLPDWIYEIYYDEYHDLLFRYANYYQTIVYGALLAYVVSLFFKKNRSMSYVPLIAIVGGFLFSIIWEAQCRYVLPYYMFMMVYVPVGLCNICDGIGWFMLKLSFKKTNTPTPPSGQNDSSAA